MTDTKTQRLNVNDKAKVKKLFSKSLVYLFLGLACLVVLFPFYIAVITSFKGAQEANGLDFTWWPKKFTIDGYKDVFTYTGGSRLTSPLIIRGFFNTILMVLPRALISTTLSCMAGFAYAKLNFKGKNGMFSFLLSTMMVPGIITLIPSYIIFYELGWINTPLPVVMPALLGTTSAVFFMRQYYMGVPSDMMEAASIDGLGYFGTYFRIMFPIAMPAFWAQFVLAFVGGYNEYLGPMLYLTKPEMYTMQIALQQYATSRQRSDPGAVMASAVIALLPIVALFLIAQKQFISGVVTSGVKL